MQRIAFLRSADIRRADPYIHGIAPALAELGAQARLFHTHRDDCGPDLFPGTSERLDPAATPDEFVDRVRAWGADAAVSISLPDENALRDAVVKTRLEALGIRTVMTPLAATRVLCDKWETKRALTAHGLTTPPAVLVDSDLLNDRALPVPAYPDAVRLAARDIGFPLLAKPLWDSTSMGIRFIPDPDALNAYLADPPAAHAVLEKCVAGRLCSVDIVGAGGHYTVQPLIWTGTAGGPPRFTFDDLRHVSPAPRDDFRATAQRLVRLCTALGVEGSVNVDMIHADGVYHVLEINPRIGGATTLSIAAGGLNTFAALLDILAGTWPTRTEAPAERFAIECLTANPTPGLLAELRSRIDLVTCHDLVIDGHDHGGILTFTVEPGDERRAVKDLTELSAQTGFMAPSMLDKIRRLLTPTDR
ncbi:ATP-grasp domain-containing protein [Streptomyces sp. NBC_00588]|uniref:ATP-grasp domain-containing protein n=1 Tax=Streptomyces sp. NBC_00588 TaxID=2975784 RepID=UPI002E8242F6|nr:ATP-grasp domain-containing protein [Streptomyces sp. NBC_00588]WUB33556.1 ATP-grasp domain-containing protein [Streptomyces sp. NBC_00588]